MRSKEAITSNSALFTYRQVLPVDTVLVRAVLEALLVSISGLFLFTGLGFLGYKVLPDDFLQVFVALVMMWFAGTGLGLTLSVAGVLLPEIAKVTEMLFRPLYFLSAVMYPPSAIPPAYQDWLLVNPLIHGIEAFRTGFFSQYHTIPGVSTAYIAAFAASTMCLGLALHVRFAKRIMAQ
jgi:capsular polysaccharide transport system permease protein